MLGKEGGSKSYPLTCKDGLLKINITRKIFTDYEYVNSFCVLHKTINLKQMFRFEYDFLSKKY